MSISDLKPNSVVGTDGYNNLVSVDGVTQEFRSATARFSTGFNWRDVTSGAMIFDYPDACADLRPYNLAGNTSRNTSMATWGTVNAVPFLQRREIACNGLSATPPSITWYEFSRIELTKWATCCL